MEFIDSTALIIDTISYEFGFAIYPFPFTYDYKVVVDSSRTYLIQDFGLQTKKCNTCFFNEDYSYFLGSYNVNGVQINKDVIEISK